MMDDIIHRFIHSEDPEEKIGIAAELSQFIRTENPSDSSNVRLIVSRKHKTNHLKLCSIEVKEGVQKLRAGSFDIYCRRGVTYPAKITQCDKTLSIEIQAKSLADFWADNKIDGLLLDKFQIWFVKFGLSNGQILIIS